MNVVSGRSVTNPAGRPSPRNNGAAPVDEGDDGAEAVLVDIVLRLEVAPDIDIVLGDMTMDEVELPPTPVEIDIIDELDIVWAALPPDVAFETATGEDVEVVPVKVGLPDALPLEPDELVPEGALD
jgi:hypothetical protein